MARSTDHVRLATFGMLKGGREYRRLVAALESIRVLWPECPAKISSDGTGLVVDQAYAALVSDRENLVSAANGGMS